MYRIGVYGVQDGGFQLSYSVGVGIAQLSDGVGRGGTLNTGEIAYYSYQIYFTYVGGELTWALLVSAGEADIYVSDTYRRPDPALNYTFNQSSTERGSDILVVPTTRVGTWFATVIGRAANTRYSIVASYNTRQTLVSGQALYWNLYEAGNSKAFTFTVPGLASVSPAASPFLCNAHTEQHGNGVRVYELKRSAVSHNERLPLHVHTIAVSNH